MSSEKSELALTWHETVRGKTTLKFGEFLNMKSEDRISLCTSKENERAKTSLA